MHFIKMSTIIALFITSVNLAFSQAYFTKQQLWEDADNWYCTTFDIHPDMFAYISKEEFDKDFVNMKASLPDSMTLLDFYKQLAPFSTRLGDGHTMVVPPMQYLSEHTELLPLQLEIDKENYSLLVKKNLLAKENNIPEGSVILSINGRTAKEISKTLTHYMSGEKEGFRIAGLNSIDRAIVELMYVLYGETTFDILYSFAGKESFVTIHAIKSDIYNELLNKDREAPVLKDYSFTINKDINTAIIEFNSFENKEKFKTFADSVFTVIKEKNIHNLIIDIRNNGGGDSSVGDEFFQYISPVPYQQFGKMTVKISSETIDTYGHNGLYPLGSYYVYSASGEEDLRQLRDNPLRYSGNTYLLTSNMTFSSAANFSWAFQYFNMGKIVGEETGGLAVCFGDIKFKQMPNTQLGYSVSHKKFYNYGATDENIHGTLPDYEVPAEEAMDYAINLIKNKNGLK